MKKVILLIIIVLLVLFGIVTLFMSSSVIFDWFGIRAKQGHYVPFIVWSNWVCGFLYLLSAYGFVKSKLWTAKLLGTAAIILIAAFIGLIIHINSGGDYETKTVFAMVFRTGITIAFTVIAYYIVNKKRV